MTSKLTRERIELIANFHRAMALPPSHAEIEELARMALAAMDSEPYGFTDGDRRGMIYKPEHSDRLSEPVPVYRHAQPAPVVPDELLNEIDDLLSVCRVYACRSRRSGSEHDIPRTEKAQEWLRACRAAMLKGCKP